MTNKRKPIIGVIGASQPSSEGLRMAEVVGREIALRGAILVCGGLGGVMVGLNVAGAPLVVFSRC